MSQRNATSSPPSPSRWLGEIDPFLGESQRMQQLAVAVAGLDADRPILILGETGTGKGVLARWLHAQGPRANGEFVNVDCATDPRILERALFGELLESAHGGTLFMDDVSGLDGRILRRLFTTLEAGALTRADGEELALDVGLITASSRPLGALAASFHPQLWDLLLTLEIPPLRERREDIPHLAQSLLRRVASNLVDRPVLSSAAIAVLQGQRWPGNVRELKNVLERALIFSTSREIQPQDLLFDR